MKLRAAIGIILLGIIVLVSCQDNESLDFKRYYSAGSLVYKTNCQNCHGENGEGLQALMPPLTDSLFLKRNLKSLACVVKTGLKGKITIMQKEFDWQMPAINLNFMETAQALTYITNSFGNHLGVVTYDDVNADVSNCK
jgi:mono/diheme cytochrome c family protein